MSEQVPDYQAEFTFKDRGSLKVSGNFVLYGPDGKKIPISSTQIKLCRCGRSKHMPFCDNTHRED